nr:hypothetical protein CFP56_67569 [Quercus suber]
MVQMLRFGRDGKKASGNVPDWIRKPCAPAHGKRSRLARGSTLDDTLYLILTVVPIIFANRIKLLRIPLNKLHLVAFSPK